MKTVKTNLIQNWWSRLKSFLINSDERFKLGFIGVIVGITSSLAAVALNKGLHVFENFFQNLTIPFISVILPSIGLILTIVFLKYIIKDFGGHGLPEVIQSLSLKGGIIKLRSSVSRLIGSLITISFGGSAGPEAPIVISGAAIGSNIARLFKTNEKIRIAVAGSGAAAAIASIFNAPIAGIIFTMEVIIGEWTPIYLLPIVIASVTGTEISRLLNGNQIQFVHELIKVNFNDILLSVFLAIFCAFFSVIFIRILRSTSQQLSKYFKNIFWKALGAGLIIGIISFYIPVVKGEGYKFVQELITGNFSQGILFVFLIIALKILVTSLTLGAHGAGGVFAPSLVIGGSTGLFFYLIVSTLFPQLEINNVGLYPLIGMAGVLSGTLHAPLTGMFLIIEITNGYDAILPLLLVSFLTSAIVKQFEPYSIYHYELVQKGYLHRPRTDGKILAEISPMELLEIDPKIVYPDMPVSTLISKIKKSNRNYFPVVNKKDMQYLGMVFFNDIKEIIFDEDIIKSILIEDVMRDDITTISLNDSLIDIQKKFDSTNSWSLPVVDNGRYKGLISKATMLDLYRKELKVQTDL